MSGNKIYGEGLNSLVLNDMNYTEIYNNIIKRAQNRDFPALHEWHHIIPRCLGGSDKKENLVALTFKEHFVCHHLLYKIHNDNYKLIMAWHFFHNVNNVYINAKEYERTRLILKNHLSENNKGSLNPFYGKAHSEETKKLISKLHIGELNPNYGKPMSEEQKRKIGEAQMGSKNHMWGKKHSPETIKFYSLTRKGSLNPFYGKAHSEETKKLISEKMKGHQLSSEAIDSIREKLVGNKYQTPESILKSTLGFSLKVLERIPENLELNESNWDHYRSRNEITWSSLMKKFKSKEEYLDMVKRYKNNEL